MLLVHVGHLDGFAHLKLARIGLLQAHNQAEQGGLTGAVWTDNAHDAVRRQHEVEVIEEQFLAKGFGYMLRLNHLVAQARAVGNEDFQLLLLLLHILVEQLVVRVQTGLSFGLTSLGGHAHPLQLALQRLTALAGRLLLHLHTLGLLFQPAGVVALPGDALTAVQLQNPSGHVVQEVTVVRHGNHRTLILLQVLLQPVDALSVEVVGRLVEQEDVGLLKQQAAEGHAAAFAS